ncbi:MAG: coproporphyrinogen III oxidase family protein [Epsilonproteobacteria bacterium]|nr:coproporphyrinogen III oxidase family protein [Campylobacterota bacterium]
MLIYLHIPFCDSKCNYCAFNSYVDKFDLKSAYMKACTQQLKSDLLLFKPKGKSIISVFIGGGTPSTITPNLYISFFEIIKPFLCENAEITTEANPNSATLSWLKGMQKIGVNRVSFGVQSFDEKKLKFLGRNHDKKQAVNAINRAKEVGFENISLDLIYGTVLDTKELLQKDLKIAQNLPINHISAYSLTIEKNTPFYNTPSVALDSIELASFFTNSIIENGFPQYEISNFGTYNSVHNLGYWKHDDYIGIGAGAVGFFKNKRFYPTKDIQKYIKNPTKTDIEKLNHEDIHVEKIFLGLRSKIGINLKEFSQKELEKIEILIQSKKLKNKDDKIYNLNYFLSDEIALFITS